MKEVFARTGLYSISGFGQCERCGWWPLKHIDPIVFSPESLAGEGIR